MMRIARSPASSRTSMERRLASLWFAGIRADSGIESIPDLAGKTIGLGAPGSPINFLTKEVFEAHGLAEGSYTELPYGYEEVADGISNGSIDAGVIGGAIPVSTLTELAAQQDIAIVPVDAETMETLSNSSPYLFTATVDAGTYNAVDVEVLTYAFSVGVATHKDTSDELVEAMMKIMFERTEALAQVHGSARGITLENAVRGIAIPFHPAAKEYLEAAGVTVP